MKRIMLIALLACTMPVIWAENPPVGQPVIVNNTASQPVIVEPAEELGVTPFQYGFTIPEPLKSTTSESESIQIPLGKLFVIEHASYQSSCNGMPDSVAFALNIWNPNVPAPGMQYAWVSLGAAEGDFQETIANFKMHSGFGSRQIRQYVSNGGTIKASLQMAKNGSVCGGRVVITGYLRDVPKQISIPGR